MYTFIPILYSNVVRFVGFIFNQIYCHCEEISDEMSSHHYSVSCEANFSDNHNNNWKWKVLSDWLINHIMLAIFKIHRWFICRKRLDIFQLHHCEIVQRALTRAIIWKVKLIVGVKNHGNEIIVNASNWIIRVFNVSLCSSAPWTIRICGGSWLVLIDGK